MDVQIVVQIPVLMELKNCRGKCYLIWSICLRLQLCSLSEVTGEKILQCQLFSWPPLQPQLLWDDTALEVGNFQRDSCFSRMRIYFIQTYKQKSLQDFFRCWVLLLLLSDQLQILAQVVSFVEN